MTYPVPSRTRVDVGVPFSRRYESNAPKHVVELDDDGGRTIACTGRPAVRSYAGWLEVVVACSVCRRKVKEAA